jgi:hypothetical protein
MIVYVSAHEQYGICIANDQEVKFELLDARDDFKVSVSQQVPDFDDHYPTVGLRSGGWRPPADAAKNTGPARRAEAGNPCESPRRPESLSSARLSWFVCRAGCYPTGISLEKVHTICVIISLFTEMSALLAQRAAGFGQQIAPVALLPEEFPRWPPWSSPSKRSALGSAMALCFGLESACLRTAPWQHCPQIGEAQSAIARDFEDPIPVAPRKSALCFQVEHHLRTAVWW